MVPAWLGPTPCVSATALFKGLDLTPCVSAAPPFQARPARQLGHHHVQLWPARPAQDDAVAPRAVRATARAHAPPCTHPRPHPASRRPAAPLSPRCAPALVLLPCVSTAATVCRAADCFAHPCGPCMGLLPAQHERYTSEVENITKILLASKRAVKQQASVVVFSISLASPRACIHVRPMRGEANEPILSATQKCPMVSFRPAAPSTWSTHSPRRSRPTRFPTVGRECDVTSR